MEEKDYEDWIIEQLKETQADGAEMPELDLRVIMTQQFDISDGWAYELIRKIAKNPQIYLKKIRVEYWGSKKGREFAVTFGYEPT